MVEGLGCGDDTAEGVHDTRLPANAADNSRVFEKRHEIARLRLRLQQVVVNPKILLAEGRIEPLGRRLGVVQAVEDQRVADPCLISNQAVHGSNNLWSSRVAV